MKQKCMWFLFKLGLSLFTPDYMSQGREVNGTGNLITEKAS
ncbi:MAG: hypothetical protein E6X90_05595 [Veillonella sp.]|nr:hypothetical protein [Veillonella sp.]